MNQNVEELKNHFAKEQMNIENVISKLNNEFIEQQSEQQDLQDKIFAELDKVLMLAEQSSQAQKDKLI